jgi:hypothetical protein
VKVLADAKTAWETYAQTSDQLNAKADALRKSVEVQALNGIKAAVAKGIKDYQAAKNSANAQWANKVKLTFANMIGDLKVDDRGQPIWAVAWAVGVEAITIYDRQLRALGIAARELDSAASGVGLHFNLREEYPRFLLPDMLMRAEAGDRAALTQLGVVRIRTETFPGDGAGKAHPGPGSATAWRVEGRQEGQIFQRAHPWPAAHVGDRAGRRRRS